MFSRDALGSFMDKAQRSDHRNRRVKTYATKTDIAEEEEKVEFHAMCKKNHDMDNCKNFLELSVNKRSRYLAKNKLCFGCYDPITSNHSAKTQRHAPRGLYVKNVRTIIQLLFMVISAKAKQCTRKK